VFQIESWFLPGLTLDADPPASTSLVAGIIGMNHHTWIMMFFLKEHFVHTQDFEKKSGFRADRLIWWWKFQGSPLFRLWQFLLASITVSITSKKHSRNFAVW
jgi:hypothetical protein